MLVEGQTDKRVVPYLMEANGVAWEDSDGEPVVAIEALGGIEEVLKSGVVEAELAATGLEALGVVVDANGNAQERWEQLRGRCEVAVPGLPQELPEEGLSTEPQPPVGGRAPRFGVWIMPDNRLKGMLEDFLMRLARSESKPLIELAECCARTAKGRGAPFKDAHFAKAQLHTWLAWQDEPGRQMHEAVRHRVLDPAAPRSQPFVRWFRTLFSV